MLRRDEHFSQPWIVDAVNQCLNNPEVGSELWQRIKHARALTRLSGEAFGAELGVSKAAVSQWETADSARRNEPKLSHLRGIATLARLSLGWLVDDASELDPAHAPAPVQPAAGEGAWSFAPVPEMKDLTPMRRRAVEAAMQSAMYDALIKFCVSDGPAPIRAADKRPTPAAVRRSKPRKLRSESVFGGLTDSEPQPQPKQSSGAKK